MRQWGVDPRLLCDKHLLGEHVEHHMFAGSLRKGKSVKGYLEGLFDPRKLVARHAALAKEMERRGFKHGSPLPYPGDSLPAGWVNVEANKKELAGRCLECRRRIDGD